MRAESHRRTELVLLNQLLNSYRWSDECNVSTISYDLQLSLVWVQSSFEFDDVAVEKCKKMPVKLD